MKKTQKILQNPNLESPRQILTQYFFISLAVFLFYLVSLFVTRIDPGHFERWMAMGWIVLQMACYSGLFVYLKRSKRVFDYFGANYSGSFIPLNQRK